MKVYIAGPYTPTDGKEETRLENIRLASETGKLVLKLGHTPFCPHTMTAGWEDECSYDDFLRMDLEWLRACDAIVLLPSWESSKGTRIEKAEADRLGIPAFVWDGADAGLLRLHDPRDGMGRARQASSDQHLNEVRNASSETHTNQRSTCPTESDGGVFHMPVLLIASNQINDGKGNDGGGAPRPAQAAEVEPAEDGTRRALPTTDQYSTLPFGGRAEEESRRCN